MNANAKYIPCDRNNKPLAAGQLIRVQETAGPYGQTRQFTAKVLPQAGSPSLLGVYRSLNVEIVTGSWTVYGRYGNAYYKPGDRYFLQPKWMPVVDKPNHLRAYNLHDDYEHGHETWIEVIRDP